MKIWLVLTDYFNAFNADNREASLEEVANCVSKRSCLLCPGFVGARPACVLFGVDSGETERIALFQRAQQVGVWRRRHSAFMRITRWERSKILLFHGLRISRSRGDRRQYGYS